MNEWTKVKKSLNSKKCSKYQYQSLLRIIELAQVNWKKQLKLKLSHQPSFNILRVLGAFKELYPQHNQQIYNLIIYLMYKYHPRNIKDWQWATRTHYKDLQSNKYDNNINSNHHVLIPQLLNPKIKIQQKQSQKMSSKDSLDQLTKINQQHYMSFYPHQQQSYIQNNKENLSNQNYVQTRVSIQQQNQINYNDLTSSDYSSHEKTDSFHFSKHQKTKSSFPLHQRINVPKHYHQRSQQIINHRNQFLISPSPYLSKNSTDTPLNKSKITHNTKQVTQNGQDQYHLQLQQSLILRAHIFYKINSQMKAFSALLANFAAFHEFRQSLNKTKSFLEDSLKRKSFFSLNHYSKKNKQCKLIEKKCDQHRNKYLFKNIFKIFKVLHDTKIQETKQLISLQNYNIINIEFIIYLLLLQLNQSEKQLNISYSQNHQTPKQLLQKAQHYQSQGNISKIFTLLFHFGHYKPTYDQILNIYSIKNKKMLQKSFIQLHKYCNKLKQFGIRKNLYIMKKYFQAFKYSYQQKKFSSQRVMKVVGKLKQDNIISQIFNVLKQYVEYKRLYRMKIEYIYQKSIKRIKQNYLKKWIKSYQLQTSRKQSNTERIRILMNIIKRLLERKPFQQMLNYSIEDQQQQISFFQFHQTYKIRKLFENLKNNYQIRKKLKLALKAQNYNKLKETLKYWSLQFRISKGTSKIKQVFKKYQLSDIYQSFKKIKINALFHLQDIYDLKSYVFEALVTYSKSKSNETILNIRQMHNFLKKNSFITLISKNKELKQLKQNQLTVLQYIKINYISLLQLKTEKQLTIAEIKIKIFYQKLISLYKKKRSIQLKYNLVCQLIKKKKLLQVYLKIKEQMKYDLSKRKINIWKKIIIKKKIIDNIKNNVLSLKYHRLMVCRKNYYIKTILSSLKYSLLSMNRQINRATLLYKNNVKIKTIFYLANSLILTNSKISKLQIFIQNTRKISILSYFLAKCSGIKNNNKLLNKFKSFIFLKKLKHHSQITKTKNHFNILNSIKSFQLFFSRASKHKKHQQIKCIQSKQYKTLTKKIVSYLLFSRLCKFFVKALLQRKYECMAIKFRVLKLFDKGLKSLNRNCPQVKGIKQKKAQNTTNLLNQDIIEQN